MAGRHQMDLLQKIYWDNRTIKSSSGYPEIKHKITKEALWIREAIHDEVFWIDGRKGSPWTLEELRRRGLLVLPTEVRYGDFYAGEEENCKDNLKRMNFSCLASPKENLMKEENANDFKSSSLSLMTTLKVCAKKKDLHQGTRIHADIRKEGLLKKNASLGNMLVTMYAKCGALDKAQEVLDELPLRDVISWNALISGYVQHGHGEQALACYQRMTSEGLSPNAITYVCILKACGITLQAAIGKNVHDEIICQGLLKNNIMLGTALVDMYAKCGVLTQAQKVLDELPMRDVAVWNALIAGYVQKGQGKEALACFHRVKSDGLFPDAITYACVLKACSITLEAGTGQKIHDEIESRGLLEKDVVLGTALVHMYAKCGVLLKAQKVLDELPFRDVICWNALITGYVEQGQGEQALCCFRRMQSEGLAPDLITYVSVLKACGIMQEADVGEQIHDEIASQELFEDNVVLSNALVDMYAKCGSLSKAQKVLDDMPSRDTVSWNALIGGYAQQGQGEEALGCFKSMQSEGLSHNVITYACILKACGITQEVDNGQKIHDEIVSQGLLEGNVVLGNTLVDMYAKCGILDKAQKVLDKLFVRDGVSWKALILGYVQQGQGDEALVCFRRMRSEGFSADATTYACILKACGITREAELGEQIHDEIAGKGLLEKDVVLGIALVDMYVKCGVLARAQKAFDELPVRTLVAWNALIAGYAQHGENEEALDCFLHMRLEGLTPDVVSWNGLMGGYAQQGLVEDALDCFEWMQSEGTTPDAVTFISVLNVCSHAGLVDEGQMYFKNMMERYGITPVKEHHTCMVDLFGRARHLDKAMDVIKKMPFSDYPSVWSSLLGACRKWGNVKLGKLAFENALQLDGGNAAAYVLMANIYAAAGMPEEAQLIECISEECFLEAVSV